MIFFVVSVAGVTATSQTFAAATTISNQFTSNPADGVLGMAFQSLSRLNSVSFLHSYTTRDNLTSFISPHSSKLPSRKAPSPPTSSPSSSPQLPAHPLSTSAAPTPRSTPARSSIIPSRLQRGTGNSPTQISSSTASSFPVSNPGFRSCWTREVR